MTDEILARANEIYGAADLERRQGLEVAV